MKKAKPASTLATKRRWTKLRPHKEQGRLQRSSALYNVVAAGRRSGKTEIVGKRKLIRKAIRGTQYTPGANFGVGAPTRDQAKRIYWKDLKLMVPPKYIADISESQLIINLTTGDDLYCLGLDRPERIEGTPWDYLVLDEYANMKANAWGEHIEPALADRDGSCDFIGVPEGRNHFYDLWKKAQESRAKDIANGTNPIWNAFWWKSEDILSAERIKRAKEHLDELTYQQEYEASFVVFTGRAYYNFHEALHYGRVIYNPRYPIAFCFDFNVSPGVAVICQEICMYDLNGNLIPDTDKTAVIGEVYIPRNSNTVAVCNKLIKDWGDHQSWIHIYGDATGGSKGSAKVLGSDWELVKQTLAPHFGERLRYHVPRANPRERARVNSVNSRLKTLGGKIKLVIDPSKAPQTVKDFEGVTLLEGGSGEIDKKADLKLTHLSDAIGYYIAKEFPIILRGSAVTEFEGH